MMQQVATKKVLVSVMAVSLCVLPACGSKNETSTAATSSAGAPSSSVVASSVPSSSASPTTSASPTASPTPTTVHPTPEPVKKPTPAGPPPEPQAPPAPNAADLPSQGLPVGEVAPLASGRPGTQAEIAAITTMLRRQEQQTTFRGFMQNYADSLCDELVEEQGGRAAFDSSNVPDLPLAAMPEYQATATKVTAVDNVVVEGERASADVTLVDGSGVKTTNTMVFRFERNDWKLCR